MRSTGLIIYQNKFFEFFEYRESYGKIFFCIFIEIEK